MNRIRMTISALTLAALAVTVTGGVTPWGEDGHAVLADRWCC